ncbi:hypothetical protein [Dyadobacter sp. CY351]|uniref:hypothetical protein n=1 Tax=Dyadobacter sp. CY351 TaxID=2909337 RepID=UPI001F487B1D|nr:hypothetical protein [Dyadobacter sp. CY351]MCF2518416.1 hypothetical protein [Dyadobacter sp. CY351]
MSQKLPTFSQVIDQERNLILRSKYPRCIVEVFDQETQGGELVLDLLGIKLYVSVVVDFDNLGDFSNHVLKEMARWWYHNRAAGNEPLKF